MQMKQIMSDMNFQCLLLNQFLLCTGYYMASCHILLMLCIMAQNHNYVGGAMLSTLGFCNLAGRLDLSLLIQHPRVTAIYIHSLSTLSVEFL